MAHVLVTSGSYRGPLLPIPLTSASAGKIHGCQPAAKLPLDTLGGKGPGLASMQFPENMWFIIFLSVSSWVSLKSESVIIAVIIILIQIRNLSKYYTVDVTSLSHCGWRVPATHPAQHSEDVGQSLLAQKTSRSELVWILPLAIVSQTLVLHPSLILVLGLRRSIYEMGEWDQLPGRVIFAECLRESALLILSTRDVGKESPVQAWGLWHKTWLCQSASVIPVLGRGWQVKPGPCTSQTTKSENSRFNERMTGHTQHWPMTSTLTQTQTHMHTRPTHTPLSMEPFLQTPRWHCLCFCSLGAFLRK